MGKMYERKLIYGKIKSYMEKGEKSERVEERLQASLDANSAYFSDMTDEEKKKCQKLFDSGTEYLGKSVDWQNYRMLFTDLQGKNFDKLFGSILLQVQERKAQVNRVKDAVDVIHKKSTEFTGYQTFAGVIQAYRTYDKEVKDLEEQKLSKEKEREKENKAIQKMFDDAQEKYGKTIDSDKKIIENAKLQQERLRERVKTYNEAVAHVETKYANSVQEIETGLKKELENDKKELENLKIAMQEVWDRHTQTVSEFYTWGENYGTDNLETKTDEEKKTGENLRRNISTQKKRTIIDDLRFDIDKLRNDPDFNFNECIYGKEDDKLKEKYPILDWIKKHMDLQKESEELKGKQEETKELDLVMDDDRVETRDTEEINIVEGETKYAELLDVMYDNLDKMDDAYWNEIKITEKKMPDEIKQVYDAFDKATEEYYDEGNKKKDEIAEKEKAVTEKEKEVSTKMEEAKGLRDRLKEKHLFYNFNPESPKNRIGGDGTFDKFKGDYSTFPEQVDSVLKIYDDEIKVKEDNVAKLEPLYNADIEKASQARQAYDAKKGTHKAEITNLNKMIEKKKSCKNLKRRWDVITK